MIVPITNGVLKADKLNPKVAAAELAPAAAGLEDGVVGAGVVEVVFTGAMKGEVPLVGLVEVLVEALVEVVVFFVGVVFVEADALPVDGLETPVVVGGLAEVVFGVAGCCGVVSAGAGAGAGVGVEPLPDKQSVCPGCTVTC